MYTLMVNQRNELLTSVKTVIMQRSKLVDQIQILVPREYGDEDMADYSATMEYLLPVSKKYLTTELTNKGMVEYTDSDENTGEYIQYLIEADTGITQEAGNIEVQITFVNNVIITTDVTSVTGEVTTETRTETHVRKTSVGRITITPISAWSDIIPDEALTDLDRRLANMQSLVRQLEGLTDDLTAGIPSDIRIEDNNLHLIDPIEDKVGTGIDIPDIALEVTKSQRGEDPDGVEDGVVDLDALEEIQEGIINDPSGGNEEPQGEPDGIDDGVIDLDLLDLG